MTIKFTVQIRVEPDGDEYHAYCPALKGLHTCGATEQEALQHAIDAAIAYLQSLLKHGDPIPIHVEVEAPRPSKTSSRTKRVSRHIQEVSVAIA
jgi:predicted RNase H-like HicB family nuclease